MLELGVAIPHGAAFCVCRPVIAAAILEEPVDWGRDRRVDRIFLLALNLDERFKAKADYPLLFRHCDFIGRQGSL